MYYYIVVTVGDMKGLIMWVLSDRVFNKLLNGDYTVAIGMKQKYKDMSITDMYCYQFEYESYDGFRKFYNKVLSPILDGIKFIDRNTLIGKILNMLMR